MASPHLSTLPPEVLRLICTYVFQAERIVTIGSKKSSRKVNGDTPALLHVNYRLRQLAIEKYGTVFPPKEESQEYGCSHRWADLNYLANIIESHVKNIQPLPKHFVFAKKYWPAWFDPQTDVVLFEPQTNYANGAFDVTGLSDSWTWIATKIHKAAFKVDILRVDYLIPLQVNMKNLVSWAKVTSKINPEVMSDVESITVLVRHTCEVVIIRFDEDDLLKPGEWSFKLNTESQRFQGEMGGRWANVTWGNTLG